MDCWKPGNFKHDSTHRRKCLLEAGSAERKEQTASMKSYSQTKKGKLNSVVVVGKFLRFCLLRNTGTGFANNKTKQNSGMLETLKPNNRTEEICFIVNRGLGFRFWHGANKQKFSHYFPAEIPLQYFFVKSRQLTAVFPLTFQQKGGEGKLSKHSLKLSHKSSSRSLVNGLI